MVAGMQTVVNFIIPNSAVQSHQFCAMKLSLNLLVEQIYIFFLIMFRYLHVKANCVCGKFLTVFMRGILESAVYFPSLMMVTKNFAFMAGSSKHGKAARANVGSNKVAAKYLEKESSK